MQSLTCLLIDDEPLARAQLKALIEQEPSLTILGEAGRKEEALHLITTLRPHLLFLDIQMRGGGGFEILAALPQPPAVIFVTAYNQYAIRAFEVNAVDYLLKPVEPTRLRNAIEKAQRTNTTPLPPLAASDMALIPLGDSGHFVAVRDILSIEAEGRYSRVLLAGGKCHLIRLSFKNWSERLPESMFAQLDRGLIVNLARITSCTHSSRTSELFLDKLPTPVALGTAATKRLRSLINE
jgi:two-component system LytT family response regulator